MLQARASVRPKLPKNRQEVHDILQTMDIKTYDGKQFLQTNDAEKGVLFKFQIVIFIFLISFMYSLIYFPTIFITNEFIKYMSRGPTQCINLGSQFNT